MNAGQFIQWYDLFAVVDDGSVPLARYGAIEFAMRDQAKLFSDGIACLVILPPDSRPPPDDVKRRVKSLLTGLGPSLSSLAYVIEGTGFRGITVRATLVGMKIFSTERYPIYVEMSLAAALRKVLPHLVRGQTITTNVNVIVDTIMDARAAWIPPALIRQPSTVIPK